MTIRNIIATSLAVIISLVLATGCATVEGAGEDIQHAGESIQDAAD